jgi:hypothetical protein
MAISILLGEGFKGKPGQILENNGEVGEMTSAKTPSSQMAFLSVFIRG